MSDVRFDLKPVVKKPSRNYRSKRRRAAAEPILTLKTLSKSEIMELARLYDKEHPWWNTEEKRIGDRLRQNPVFGLETLKEIIHWKFYTVKSRERRTLKLIKDYSDEDIRNISRRALSTPNIRDNTRISTLREIKGVGPALASTVLTFLDPNKYCIFDIHVMRGVYGEDPANMFATNKYYLQLLHDLRAMAKQYELPVRTIEKAYFKKNLG